MTRHAVPLTALLLIGCSGLEPTIRKNPVCGLSAVVNWTTDQPASSWVEVSQGEERFRIGSDDLAVDHEVIVVGMHAEESYELEAVSVTEGGKELRSEPAAFDTDPLPEPYLQGELNTHDPALVSPGWIAANVMVASYGPVTAVILDEQGRVVWYYLHDGPDGGADIQVSWFPERQEMLLGPHFGGGDHARRIDLKGEIAWLGPEQPGDPDSLNIQDGQWHHVLFETPSGTHVTVISEYGTVDGEEVQGDRVVELSQDNTELWSWSAFDHIAYDPDDVFMYLWWMHINSVAVDEEQDVAWINSWVHSEAWKVDRASGEILWTLGADGDFAFEGEQAFPWFEFAHSFEPIGDDHYLVYDNGSSDRRWSRVVEYALDEASMTASIVWEYPGELAEDVWWVQSCGDVDLMDNGNRLVVANDRIMEITVEGEMAWEYTWIPNADTPDLRSYQAERIDSLIEWL